MSQEGRSAVSGREGRSDTRYDEEDARRASRVASTVTTPCQPHNHTCHAVSASPVPPPNSTSTHRPGYDSHTIIIICCVMQRQNTGEAVCSNFYLCMVYNKLLLFFLSLDLTPTLASTHIHVASMLALIISLQDR